MKRKAQFLDKAKKDRLRVADGLLRSFCKDGVHLQSKVGWICKGGYESQRVGSDCKDRPQNAKVGLKRKRTSRNPS